MPTLALTAPNAPPVSTPLRGKLLNVFVSPGEVFEEVVASAPHLLEGGDPGNALHVDGDEDVRHGERLLRCGGGLDRGVTFAGVA